MLGLMSPEDMSTVFSNVEQLRNLNQEFFSSLQGLNELPISEQDVGARFASFVSNLSPHTERFLLRMCDQFTLHFLTKVKKLLIILVTD